jgi:pimeloyl-ACP methyl ester carboxylesterase
MLDLAMDLLRESVIDKGYWYSAEHLGDDDLEALRPRPEFQKLVEMCSKREMEASQKAMSDMVLISPRSPIHATKAPLVVALHGNQLNIQTTRLDWGGDSFSDCFIALPQSSRAVCSGAYSWVDPATGVQEVKHHMDSIFRRHDVDRDQVILGGFSAGARVALHLILKGSVKVRGVILLAPWLPDLVALEPMLPVLQSEGTKAYLICGDKDTDCFDSSNRLAESMETNDVPFRYCVVNGMGHCYPSDFDQQLRKARSFILHK